MHLYKTVDRMQEAKPHGILDKALSCQNPPSTNQMLSQHYQQDWSLLSLLEMEVFEVPALLACPIMLLRLVMKYRVDST